MRPAGSTVTAKRSGRWRSTRTFDSGAATAVGMRLIPLNGNAFGVDFNPVPDLLRIVSDLGQNIRIRPADGTVAGTDTGLAYGDGRPELDEDAARRGRSVSRAWTSRGTIRLPEETFSIERPGRPRIDRDTYLTFPPPHEQTLHWTGIFPRSLSRRRARELTHGLLHGVR